MTLAHQNDLKTQKFKQRKKTFFFQKYFWNMKTNKLNFLSYIEISTGFRVLLICDKLKKANDRVNALCLLYVLFF